MLDNDTSTYVNTTNVNDVNPSAAEVTFVQCTEKAKKNMKIV